MQVRRPFRRPRARALPAVVLALLLVTASGIAAAGVPADGAEAAAEDPEDPGTDPEDPGTDPEDPGTGPGDPEDEELLEDGDGVVKPAVATDPKIAPVMRACPSSGSGAEDGSLHVHWAGDFEDLTELVEVRVRMVWDGGAGASGWAGGFSNGFDLSSVPVTEFYGIDWDLEDGYALEVQTNAGSGWKDWDSVPITEPTVVPLAGAGTRPDPYQIGTVAELGAYACLAGDAPFARLVDDIDLEGVTFLPIGGSFDWQVDITGGGASDATPDYASGRLDGGGHAISNLRIDLPLHDRIGLFGDARSLSVHDLRLVAPSVAGTQFVGSLLGLAEASTFRRIAVEGASVAGVSRVGGLAGKFEFVSLTRIDVEAAVTATGRAFDGTSSRDERHPNQVGGLVGTDTSSYVARANVVARVTATAAPDVGNDGEMYEVGGLTGRLEKQNYYEDVTGTLTVRVFGNRVRDIAGVFGTDYLDDGSFVTDSRFTVDVEIRPLAIRPLVDGDGGPSTVPDVAWREIGGLGSEAEEVGISRTVVTGSLRVIARDDDEAPGRGGSIQQVGGYLGVAARSTVYTSSLAESHIGVDVLLDGGAADVEEVGALIGAMQQGTVSILDTRVDGSVDVSSSGTIKEVGGLIGRRSDLVINGQDPGRNPLFVSEVIWRGGLTINGDSGDEDLLGISGSEVRTADYTGVGTLLGDDEDALTPRALCVYWDDTNGYFEDDERLPGQSATSAELASLAFLADCGFDVSDTWCVVDGVPSVVAVTPACQARGGGGGGGGGRSGAPVPSSVPSGLGLTPLQWLVLAVGLAGVAGFAAGRVRLRPDGR
jgi:hypothetical protein